MTAIPPDFDHLHWADGAHPQTTTEPDEGLKDEGYDEFAEPAAEHWNWLIKNLCDAARYMARETFPFETLAEGIAASAVGESFRVKQSRTFGRLELEFHQAYPSGTDNDCLCTDGLRIYYGYNDIVHKVRAFDPDTAAILWTAQLANFCNIDAICTDGNYVYYTGRTDDDPDDVYSLTVLSCSTGAVVATHILSAKSRCVACNGTYVTVGLEGDMGDGDGVDVFRWTGAVFDFERTDSLANAPFSIACGDAIYAVGLEVNLMTTIAQAFLLSDGTGFLKVPQTLWDAPPTHCRGVYLDADFLYLATTPCTTDAAPTILGCVWKVWLSAGDSGIVDPWQCIVPPGGVNRAVNDIGCPHAMNLAGDDRYLYYVAKYPGEGDGYRIEMIEKNSMAMVVRDDEQPIGSNVLTGVAVDGIGVIVLDTTNKMILKFSAGYPARQFQRVGPTAVGECSDVRRYPIQGALAIPLW